MKYSRRTSRIGIAALAGAAVMLTAVPSRAQLPKDPVERAKAIEQVLRVNARQLTLFDRSGKEVQAVGPKDLWAQPILSPDAQRIVSARPDLDKETNDLWVIDVATGNTLQLTHGAARENATSPAWSPDGSQLAYAALRQGAFGLYRKASNGTGDEDLLYRSNAPLVLTDWSMDGKYLVYYATDLSGGTLFALPMTGTGERKPIEITRSQSQLTGPRLSPDDRWVVYVSNESGRTELYVRPFDPAAAPGAAPSAGPWKVSEQGASGMGFWRRDGKELYFLAADRSIMAVAVSASTRFEFGKPAVLFRPPETTPIAPNTANISRDGTRIVFSVPPPQLRQLTIFDRDGKVVKTVGQPGLFAQPHLSPDGSRIVVMTNDPKTGNQDILTVDVATGKSTPVTNDTPPENAPIWSPDGKAVAYVSTRGNYSGIYRRAGDGSGDEELLFRYTPGAGMVLTDWSPDGKFLTFYTGVLALVPLRADQKPLDRTAIDWLREDYDVVQGRFSPDGRYLAFLSNEADPEKLQVYVRPFDAAKPDAPGPGPAIQVSKEKGGAIGMVFWRQDGREMYFLNRDWEVMAVDVTTTPAFQAGTPRLLFKLQGPLPGNPAQWKNVSADGKLFVFAMPMTAGAAR